MLVTVVWDGPDLSPLNHTLVSQFRELALNIGRYALDSDLRVEDQGNIVLREERLRIPHGMNTTMICTMLSSPSSAMGQAIAGSNLGLILDAIELSCFIKRNVPGGRREFSG